MSIDRSVFFSFFSLPSSSFFFFQSNSRGRSEGKGKEIERLILRERTMEGKEETYLRLMDSRYIIAFEINFYWYKAERLP